MRSLCYERAFALALLLTAILVSSPTATAASISRIHADSSRSVNAPSVTGNAIFHVVDSYSHAPIAGANITQAYIPEGYPRLSKTTDSNGYALFTLQAGVTFFNVSANGYESMIVQVHVAPDEPTRHVDVSLSPLGVEPPSFMAELASIAFGAIILVLLLGLVWFIVGTQFGRKGNKDN